MRKHNKNSCDWIAGSSPAMTEERKSAREWQRKEKQARKWQQKEKGKNP